MGVYGLWVYLDPMLYASRVQKIMLEKRPVDKVRYAYRVHNKQHNDETMKPEAHASRKLKV